MNRSMEFCLVIKAFDLWLFFCVWSSVVFLYDEDELKIYTYIGSLFNYENLLEVSIFESSGGYFVSST